MGQQDPERDGKSNLYGPDERIHAKLDQKIILDLELDVHLVDEL